MVIELNLLICHRADILIYALSYPIKCINIGA